MSEITTLQFQRKTRPKIEEVLPYYLDGEKLESALNFIAYLRSERMNPGWAGVHNAWKAAYKGKPIYYIRLGKEWVRKTENANWVIIPYLNHMNEYQDKIFNEGWQNIIWDDLHYCRQCNNGCSPGVTRTILGKEISGLCNGILYSGRQPVCFVNPDEAAIDRVKSLLGFEKAARNDSD